jgi:hypothetical protein
MKVLFARVISPICMLLFSLISTISRGDETVENVSHGSSEMVGPVAEKATDISKTKTGSEAVLEKKGSGEEVSVDEPKSVPRTKREIATWSLVGLTGVSAITGGIFSLTALAEEDRSNVNPADEFDDRADTRTIVSNVFYGVAGAAAAAALIVWLAMDDSSETHQDADEPPVIDSEVSMRWNGNSVQIIF